MKKILFLVIASVSFIPLLSHAQNCGTTNIALNKPVAVSSFVQYHEGYRAVDGNGAEAWFAAIVDTSYIIVDLQQSYSVCKIRINWFVDGRGKNYLAQISNDSTNWTTIFTRTNNNATSDSFNVSGTGRFVRIYCTQKVNSWAGLEIGELRIFNQLVNNKPSVNLVTPANNTTLYGGTNLTLMANASDVDGTVSKVEFYQGATKIGESTTAPYAFNWTNVQPGNYVLKAKAIDNGSADSLSTGINVTVHPTNRWSLTGNAGTAPDTSFLGTTDNKRLVFKTDNVERMTVLTDGFVGIGTSTKPHAEAKLGVEGAIYAQKLKVTQTGWADYVFGENYKLPTLKEIEDHIKKYKHLPGVPSEAEVKKNGTDVAEIQATLLKKIEELTLYVIEQNKKLEAQQQEIEKLKKHLENK